VGWWQLAVGAPSDDDVHERGERRENLGALVLLFIGALAALAVFAPLRDGVPVLGQLLALAGAAAAVEVGWQIVERRRGRILWLLVTKLALFAAGIGAALWVCVSVPHPVAYMRYTIVFLIYLLLIATSGLRDEPRLPLASGLAAMVSYGIVVSLIPDVVATSPPAKAEVLSRGFDDTSVIGHSAMLLCMTMMAAASARRGQALRRLSVHDGLTGLLNRRAFDERLAAEGKRVQRSGTGLSVAMIDIDLFKSLNDRHGHALGDEVLRWVGLLLKESFRTTDVVARYGGEEFAVVFVDSAEAGVLERLDALRRRIEGAELRRPGDGTAVRVSVSIGVARWPQDGPDVDAVLAEADGRLYLAKDGGRNRLVATSDGAAWSSRDSEAARDSEPAR
jgi:diguanylate cyclase (GGDEF)-like protein